MVLSKRQERRAVETAIKVILWPINLAFPSFFNIPVATMARAILNKTLVPATEKVEVLENKDMHRAAAS